MACRLHDIRWRGQRSRPARSPILRCPHSPANGPRPFWGRSTPTLGGREGRCPVVRPAWLRSDTCEKPSRGSVHEAWVVIRTPMPLPLLRIASTWPTRDRVQGEGKLSRGDGAGPNKRVSHLHWTSTSPRPTVWPDVESNWRQPVRLCLLPGPRRRARVWVRQATQNQQTLIRNPAKR